MTRAMSDGCRVTLLLDVGHRHGEQARIRLDEADRLGLPAARRWFTQGSRVSSVSAPVSRSASVRPARFVVLSPSPT